MRQYARLNIIGAIQLGNLSEAITGQYDTINSDSIIEFMNKIRKQYAESKTIHMIVEQAGYHKSKLVREEAEKLHIELVYLPPYSPNLYPH